MSTHNAPVWFIAELLSGSIYYGLMATGDSGRTIRLPQWLWDEIDRDARRCKRSAVKQIEAVLGVYYRGETVDLDPKHIKNIPDKPKRRLGSKK